MKITLSTMITLSLLLSIILIATGCEQSSIETTELTKELTTETTALQMNESITPYQFLFYQCGNSEYLQFTYTLDTEDAFPVDVYMYESRIAAYYYQYNMNNDLVFVRQIEKDGNVHYIMDDTKQIKTYMSPATDFMFDYLLNISRNTPKSIENDGETTIFKYMIPANYDENVSIIYQLEMIDQVLVKMTELKNETDQISYLFGNFSTNPFELTVFDVPNDYTQEVFDYIYSGDFMPPWWDVNND